MKKRVLVLGATGSIGSQTIDICRNMKDRFEVCGVAVGKNQDALNSLCKEFNCKGTCFATDGIQGIENLIKTSNADIAVNGIAGAAGLKPSVMVLENGIDLALANKETVVMAWDVVKEIGKQHNAKIIPVDSEHSAIFNLTQRFGNQNIDELVITASGGPFRDFTKEQLENVTLEMTLNHPTWKMGPKITVDSSSLANKGLEVIEAARLFGFTTDKIKVVVHPQSLIHSLIRTKDGELYAQISAPDMRHPIFGALIWPEVDYNYLEKFDLFDREMTFYKPRFDAFPLLSYAYDCAAKGNAYTIAFNAANEEAVYSFLDKKLMYKDIPSVVNEVLQSDWSEKIDCLDTVYSNDTKARNLAKKAIKQILGE